MVHNRFFWPFYPFPAFDEKKLQPTQSDSKIRGQAYMQAKAESLLRKMNRREAPHHRTWNQTDRHNQHHSTNSSHEQALDEAHEAGQNQTRRHRTEDPG